MLKKILFIGLLISSRFIWAADAELIALDKLRTSDATAKVTTRIEVFEQGELTSRSDMDVYVGDDRRSLAVYRSQREAGQKVLMVEDQFWLFLPSSKRAMRITAMQKMLGEASAGDVASLAWAEDYQVIERTLIDGKLRLELVAARKGLSYSKVVLWLQPNSLHPINADLYLKSGKLAKQAEFEIVQEGEQFRVASMTLADQLQKAQQTRISYLAIEPMAMKDKWFTPQFLLRSTP